MGVAGSVGAGLIIAETTEPESGTIVSLEHRPEWAETYHYCSVRSPIGRYLEMSKEVRHYPAIWNVVYEDESGQTGRGSATEEEYETYNVGDYYVNED